MTRFNFSDLVKAKWFMIEMKYSSSQGNEGANY